MVSKLSIRPQARVAAMLGVLCSVCYLAVYYARNILGTVTPQMVESGTFTEEYIGVLSSVFFTAYAVGQLINGLVGDRIKAKYMIFVGLLAAGIGNWLFSYVTQTVAVVAYGAVGFFLSMIYAPMSKLVAENTEPLYAVRCSIGYNFASFFGSPLAGITATVATWRGAFGMASGALIVMAVVSFVLFTIMERRGYIRYGQFSRSRDTGSVRTLLQHRFIPFLFVAMFTGVVRTTVVFWMPTYFMQYLGFPSEQAVLIYTAATLVLSMDAVVAIFLYEKVFKRNMYRSTLVYFLLAALAFGGMIVCSQPVLNIVLMVLAVFMACGASSILWSCYCPSLRDTGMVSRATGSLNFASYIAASIASTGFAKALPWIGWRGLIVCWLALMAIGALLMLPRKQKTSGSL